MRVIPICALNRFIWTDLYLENSKIEIHQVGKYFEGNAKNINVTSNRSIYRKVRLGFSKLPPKCLIKFLSN